MDKGDVRVKHRKTGEIHEMSEYSFSLLNSDYELALPDANKRPVIEEPVKVESLLTTPEPKQELSLTEQYEKLFGKKPHGRMKEGTIKEAIEQALKEKSFEVHPEPGD